MYNLVKIGEKDVPMLSTASVDYFFKTIFREDPFKIQTEHSNVPGVMIDFTIKMGFIMAKFAESTNRKDMLMLNEDAFYEWLDEFERPDLFGALDEIQATYEAQTGTGSKAKKKTEEPTGA